jgi:hypothetical protein
MSILVHKDLLGHSKHALLEDGMIRWVDHKPKKCLSYGFKDSDSSLEDIAKLFDIKLPKLIPDEFERAMEVCGATRPQWIHVLPRKRFRKEFEKFMAQLSHAESILAKERYTSFFIETSGILESLSAAHVDLHECENILHTEDSHNIKSILEMSAGAKLPIVKYSRVSTKTGRMTVSSGPQVLTLKKEHKRIFRPSSPKMKLYEIDFTSLEPRVASNIAGRQAENDLYVEIAKHFGTKINRDISKLAVLCALYGAGKYKLEGILDKSPGNLDPEELISEVKSFFGVNDLVAGLKKQALDGSIKNYFGRPIFVQDDRAGLLVNNFLQSTAVDVALYGFLQFYNTFSNEANPLFIIHDAMVFEANPNKLLEMTEYIDRGICIEGLGNFPLKLKELHNE